MNEPPLPQPQTLYEFKFLSTKSREVKARELVTAKARRDLLRAQGRSEAQRHQQGETTSYDKRLRAAAEARGFEFLSDAEWKEHLESVREEKLFQDSLKSRTSAQVERARKLEQKDKERREREKKKVKEAEEKWYHTTWTPEENQILVKLRMEGKTNPEIANLLPNRTLYGVQDQVQRLKKDGILEDEKLYKD